MQAKGYSSPGVGWQAIPGPQGSFEHTSLYGSTLGLCLARWIVPPSSAPPGADGLWVFEGLLLLSLTPGVEPGVLPGAGTVISGVGGVSSRRRELPLGVAEDGEGVGTVGFVCPTGSSP